MSHLLLVLLINIIATGSIHDHLQQHDYILITISDEPLNWVMAQKYCATHFDSRLATIFSPEDLEIINTYSVSPAMIGLQQNEQNGIWSWNNKDGPICDSFCNELFVSNTDQLSFSYHCSQLIINPITNKPELHSLDCYNEPINQFYCDKSQYVLNI